MKEEFCLSDKSYKRPMSKIDRQILDVRDVKEFIKRLKEDLKNHPDIHIDYLIDKLAGDSLI